MICDVSWTLRTEGFANYSLHDDTQDGDGDGVDAQIGTGELGDALYHFLGQLKYTWRKLSRLTGSDSRQKQHRRPDITTTSA